MSGLHKTDALPYLKAMARKSPKDTIKIRPLPRQGEKILVELEVTRTGKNSFGTAETVTLDVPGFVGGKITATWDYLAPRVKN